MSVVMFGPFGERGDRHNGLSTFPAKLLRSGRFVWLVFGVRLRYPGTSVPKEILQDLLELSELGRVSPGQIRAFAEVLFQIVKLPSIPFVEANEFPIPRSHHAEWSDFSAVMRKMPEKSALEKIFFSQQQGHQALSVYGAVGG